MIDLAKIGKLISLLKNGNTLLYSEYTGQYLVRMNPQQNRITLEAFDDNAKERLSKRIVDKDNCIHVSPDCMTEQLLAYCILWNTGNWFIYEKGHKVICANCCGKGTIDNSPILTEI